MEQELDIVERAQETNEYIEKYNALEEDYRENLISSDHAFLMKCLISVALALPIIYMVCANIFNYSSDWLFFVTTPISLFSSLTVMFHTYVYKAKLAQRELPPTVFGRLVNKLTKKSREQSKAVTDSYIELHKKCSFLYSVDTQNQIRQLFEDNMPLAGTVEAFKHNEAYTNFNLHIRDKNYIQAVLWINKAFQDKPEIKSDLLKKYL